MTPTDTLQTYHLLHKEMSEVAEHYQELAAALAPIHPIAAHQLRQMAQLAYQIVRSTAWRIEDIEAPGKGVAT